MTQLGLSAIDGLTQITLFDVVAASLKATDTPIVTPDAKADIETSSGTPSLTNSATVGLLVPFTAREDTAESVKTFVQGATDLAAAEPGTLQWFGSAVQNVTTADFLVFDTFANAADRDAHLAGDVAAGLLAQIGTHFFSPQAAAPLLLSVLTPRAAAASLTTIDVIPFDILAIKSKNDAAAATSSATAGVTLGLRVLFNATSADTVAQVQDLCRSGLAQIEAEVGTLNWICGQVPQTQTFVILDSFATEDEYVWFFFPSFLLLERESCFCSKTFFFFGS